MEAYAHINTAQTESEKIGREEEWLMDLYLKEAISIEAVKERGDQLKLRKPEMNAFLASADEPPPLLHPAMAQQYRIRVRQLYETLQDDSEEKRVEGAKVIRSLVEDIVLTSTDDKMEIDVRGDLTGILTLSAERKNPAAGAARSQVKMVVWARNYRYRHSLEVAI